MRYYWNSMQMARRGYDDSALQEKRKKEYMESDIREDGRLRCKMINDIIINIQNGIQIEDAIKKYIENNKSFLDEHFGYIKKNKIPYDEWITRLVKGALKKKKELNDREI